MGQCIVLVMIIAMVVIAMVVIAMMIIAMVVIMMVPVIAVFRAVRAVVRYVAIAVPIVAHEQDRPVAGVVFAAMPAPIPLITRPHVQINGIAAYACPNGDGPAVD